MKNRLNDDIAFWHWARARQAKGGTSWSSYWETLFKNSIGTEGIYIQRIDDGSNLHNYYYIAQRLYNNICNVTTLDVPFDPIVGDTFPRLYAKNIKKALTLYNTATTPAVTLNASWSNSAGNYYDEILQSKGGRWAYSNASGAYLQLTTPSNATELYLLQVTGTTTGCAAIVEIDGDRTLANQLPTAQTLVDAGTLPNTILVANGGAFNPTDRVLEYYTNRTLHSIPIATGLTAGSHVLKITRTTHKHASSVGDYIYYNSIGVGMTNASLTTAGLYFRTEQAIWGGAGGYPVDEFAYNVLPTGATSPGWIGHTGSCKIAEVPTLNIDGVSVSMNNRDVEIGDTIVFHVVLDTFHGEIGGGTTSIGTLDLTMSWNKETGLTIGHTYTLAVAGSVSGYPSMMCTDDVLDKATYPEATVDYNLLADDGALHGKHTGKMFVAWDSDGNAACLMYIPDLSYVNNWATSVNKFYYLDNNTGNWNKAYAERFNVTPFSSGDVWSSVCNYRTQWFPSGANAQLAK